MGPKRIVIDTLTSRYPEIVYVTQKVGVKNLYQGLKFEFDSNFPTSKKWIFLGVQNFETRLFFLSAKMIYYEFSGSRTSKS